ncbi:MAG: leucyl/phenylalanyl-tRNA--protein transferase [Alkalispirochaeta sp.]
MEYLDATQRIRFPDPRRADPWGLLATGGNLSPGIVLSAYEQGIFPWYDREPILWFSPDPRFVLYLDEFVVSSRLRRTVRNSRYTVTFDHDFDGVIQGCRTVRKRGDGTWITPEMYDAYRELHRLGYTHSVEVWDGSELVGGLYGLGIATFFAGESMFSRRRDASKFAFLALVGYFDSLGIPMIDCQSYTDYLASFGAVEIPRDRFLEEMTILRTTITPSLDWRATGEDRSDGRGFLERGIALGTRNRERLGRIGQ